MHKIQFIHSLTIVDNKNTQSLTHGVCLSHFPVVAAASLHDTMHRQSLGSPSPKLPNLDTMLITTDLDDAPKPHRLSSPPPPPHKFIHLIPLLTLLCFFVLYLFSHTPSQSDLTHFAGFNRSPSHRLDSVSEIGQYMDVKRSDVLAIRSLQQIPKSRRNRKLADF